MRLLPASLAAIVAMSPWAAGCSDGLFRSRRADRQQRTKEYLDWYSAYNAAGAQRMQRIQEYSDERRALHEKELGETLKRIDEALEEDGKRWEKGHPGRVEHLKAIEMKRLEKIDKARGDSLPN